MPVVELRDFVGRLKSLLIDYNGPEFWLELRIIWDYGPLLRNFSVMKAFGFGVMIRSLDWWYVFCTDDAVHLKFLAYTTLFNTS